MKRSIINLIISALLLGLGLFAPHSPFKVTLETAPPPAPVLAAGSSDTVLPASTDTPTPPPDPFGELYFTLASFDQPPRLVRLPGACVTGQSPCPAAETVPTPFDIKDVFTTKPEGMAWSRDGRYGVLVTHPEDELSRGRTTAEMEQLKTQTPADFQVSTSTIYLFDAENNTWSELYHADRKFIYPPAWNSDGQWMAFAVRSSGWAFHPNQSDDGIYAIHPDGSGLKQLASLDATILGWIGSSVVVQRTIGPYSVVNYAIEMLSLDGQVTSLFTSKRLAYYNLAPDGGALLVTDAQGERPGGPPKAVDLLALDGTVTHTFAVYSNFTQSIWATDWSSDSSQVAYANLRRAYVAPRDGEPREVYLADDTYVEPTIWSMQFSPDQKFLILDVYDGTPKLVVVSLEGGQSAELTWEGRRSEEQATNISWRP